MNSKWINIAIFFLVIIIVGLGIFILSEYMNENGQRSTDEITLQNNSPAASPVDSSDSLNPISERPLTEDELRVLEFPATNASDTERRAHGDLVSEMTVLSNTLDLTACRPYPIVIGVNSGSDVTIVNQSSTQLEIQYGNSLTPILPNSSNSYSISDIFGDEPGDYGYSCAGTERQGIVGIVKVIN